MSKSRWRSLSHKIKPLGTCYKYRTMISSWDFFPKLKYHPIKTFQLNSALILYEIITITAINNPDLPRESASEIWILVVADGTLFWTVNDHPQSLTVCSYNYRTGMTWVPFVKRTVFLLVRRVHTHVRNLGRLFCHHKYDLQMWTERVS